jgi:hypothetical protein
MNNKKYRKIAKLVAVMMLVMSFSSTGFASWLDQTIKASYRNITVFVNGTLKQARTAQGTVVEPFIVDGTTYVPLRGIAEMLGYTVNFNPTTYRIDITGTDISTLSQKIIQQEATIKSLEAKLAAYEEVDLDDLEDDLIDDYEKIGTLDVTDIILKGDAKAIKVEIYVDLDTSAKVTAWEELEDEEDELIEFLQDIVDDILRVAKDADVSGFIEDEKTDKELIKFSINTKDNVVLGSSSTSTGDIADLEDELNDDFDRLSGVRFDITVTEKSGSRLQVVLDSNVTDVTKVIDVDDMEDFLEDMYDVIVSYDEFEDHDVYGFIEDNMGDLSFEFDSRGNVDLEWY